MTETELSQYSADISERQEPELRMDRGSENSGEQYDAEQKAVIDADGRIIVSASAGSGKTKVMIDRMENELSRENCDVGEILALTFTKKAAAQMRDRLEKKLIGEINALTDLEEGTGQACGEEKEALQKRKNHLKKQLEGLPTAQISTIHSFCADLIRSYFYKTGGEGEEGVDALFEIMTDEDADEAELQQRALGNVFSEAYGGAEEEADPDFMELLSIYYRKKNDGALKKLILEIYKKMRVQEGYMERLERIERGEDVSFEKICESLLKGVKQDVDHVLPVLKAYADELEILSEPAATEDVQKIIGVCEKILNTEDYFDLCEKGIEFPDKTSLVDSRVKDLHDKAVSICDDNLQPIVKKLKEMGKRATVLEGVKQDVDHVFPELKTYADELETLGEPAATEDVQGIIDVCEKILNTEDYFDLCGKGIEFPDKTPLVDSRVKELYDKAVSVCDDNLQPIVKELKETGKRATVWEGVKQDVDHVLPELKTYADELETLGEPKDTEYVQGLIKACEKILGAEDYFDLCGQGIEFPDKPRNKKVSPRVKELRDKAASICDDLKLKTRIKEMNKTRDRATESAWWKDAKKVVRDKLPELKTYADELETLGTPEATEDVKKIIEVCEEILNTEDYLDLCGKGIKLPSKMKGTGVSRRALDLRDKAASICDDLELKTRIKEMNKTGDRATESAWWKDEKKVVRDKLPELKTYADELETLGMPGATKDVKKIIEVCEEILNTKDYLDLCGKEIKLPSKMRGTGVSPRAMELRNKAVNIRDKYLKEQIKTGDRATENARWEDANKTARRLAKYVLKFDAEYTACKRAIGLLDYSDLEHIALRLLKDEEIRQETQKKYKYVFVDEYQDVNPLQDEIIRQVAGENLFLVGDVKQSIYRFRGSSSSYFSRKWEEFLQGGDNGGANDACALELNTNYRSGPGILKAVNAFFAGGSAPDGAGREQYPYPGKLLYGYTDMKGGSKYEEDEGRVGVYVLDDNSDDVGADEEDDSDKVGSDETVSKESTQGDGTLLGVYSVRTAYGEAKDPQHSGETENFQLGCRVWEIIEKTKADKAENDKKGAAETACEEKRKYRGADYGGIAILTPKLTGKTVSKLVNYLVRKNIPVTCSAKGDLLSFPEVRQLMDILSLIDNPAQDIPLCSALLSGMGRLTNDDLAEIEISYKQSGAPFYEKAKWFCKKVGAKEELVQKLSRFYALLKKYRALSQMISAGELLERLIAEADIEADWQSRTNGVQRMEHIQALVARGRDKTVHEFLEYLKGAEKITVSENGGENSVRISTIHSAKGLEYPVVILIGLGETGKSDSMKAAYSGTFGLAPRYYDTEKREYHETLQGRAIRAEERRESLTDRINLLYVAMTRAEYALYIILNKKDAKSPADPYFSRTLAGLLDRSVLENYLVSPKEGESLMADGVPAGPGSEALSAPGGEAVSGECLVQEIRDSYAYRYPYPNLRNDDVRLRSSASGLIRLSGGHESEDGFYRKEETDEDEPMAADQTVLTDIGTAYHSFLEHADFAASDGALELDRLEAEGLLGKEQAELISRDKAREILAMPLFKRLSGAKLRHEQPFIVYLPAKEFYKTDSEEEVLFQGFIDLLAETDEGIEIIDYKFSDRTPDSIRETYAQQAKLYTHAVAKIMKKDIAEIRFTFVNIKHGDTIPVNWE